MFRVTRYPMISKTESGRVGYRKKYRVAGRVRVPAGHWFCTEKHFSEGTKTKFNPKPNTEATSILNILWKRHRNKNLCTEVIELRGYILVIVTDGLFHLAFCSEKHFPRVQKLNSIQNHILEHPSLISYVRGHRNVNHGGHLSHQQRKEQHAKY